MLNSLNADHNLQLTTTINFWPTVYAYKLTKSARIAHLFWATRGTNKFRCQLEQLNYQFGRFGTEALEANVAATRRAFPSSQSVTNFCDLTHQIVA